MALLLGLELPLARALAVGLRVSMLMVFAPFFGSMAVPTRIKAGFTVALTALLYPVVALPPAPFGVLDWFSVVVGEMAVGLLIGLCMHFVFDGVQIAGQVLGFQLGFSLVNLIDPQSQVDTPVLSIFHQVITLLIFLRLEVHHWLLRGLARSFEYVPFGVAAATPAATAELLRAAGGMFLVAVQIATPVLAATMLADVTLGFLGKTSPQLPVLFLGISVKALIGFAVLIGAVAFWPEILGSHFRQALAAGERLLHLAH